MKKQFILTFFFAMVYLVSLTQTNTWNGSSNNNWHNNSNWSLGHIPLSSEDVIITTSGYSCIVNNYDEVCNSLTVNTGAELGISAQKLTVNGTVDIYGQLEMTSTFSELDCMDINWQNSSSASMTGSSTIYVEGDWEFASGTEVFLSGGYVDFDGPGISHIHSKDDNSHFNHIRNYKSSGYLTHSMESTFPLKVNGNIYCYAGAELQSSTSEFIELNGFINNISGQIHLSNGTFKFVGGNTTNHFLSGDYFNHLINASIGTTTFDDNIEIIGKVRLESGVLSPGANTITVGGNWENVTGPGAFNEGSGKVVFNGIGHQYCNFNENFNTLEINKPDGTLRVNNMAAEIFCVTYDWTQGGIAVVEGTFTANNLADNNIEGSWYVYEDGEVNLTNIVGYVDLAGDVSIYGGTMNVYGGQDDSYWPADDEASIEMIGGYLNFHDVGIYIRNTGTLNESLDFCRIATIGNLRIDRSYFLLSDGYFIMKGTTDTYIEVTDGWFNQLIVDKTESINVNITGLGNANMNVPYSGNSLKQTNSNPKQPGIYQTGFKGRDGKVYTPTKSNTVTLNSNISTVWNLSIAEGTLDLNGYQFNLVEAMGIQENGILQMTNPSDHLIARNIYWNNGSSANMTNGLLEVKENWVFANGTNCQISSGNMVKFAYEAGANGIECHDDNAHFGSVTIDDYIYLNASSTDTVRIAGDLTVNTGRTFTLFDQSLIVDGTVDIVDGGTMEVYSGSNGGTLEINSDFILNGELDVGAGDVLINGEFDLETTGFLTIDGGNFIYNQGASEFPLNIRGTFNMSDGLYHSKEFFGISSSAVTNVSGGIIKVASINAESTGTFQPTGGQVELHSDSIGGAISILCSNGNFFNNLKINYPASTARLLTDISVQNDLLITAGDLWINGYILSVQNDIDIYGSLRMDNTLDILNVENDIRWKPGSEENIVSGTINVHGSWFFENGTNCQISPGNTVNFYNSPALDVIQNMDADAEFGTVIVDNTHLYISGYSSHPVHIAGDFTINPYGGVYIHSRSIIVNGTLDIMDLGNIDVSDGFLQEGYLEVNSDFILNGELDVGIGHVVVHGEFDIETTGHMYIGGGSFISDQGNSTFPLNIRGTFGMSDGLYQSPEFFGVSPTAIVNVSGGLIRVGSFHAESPGTFHPTGGTVEIQTHNNGYGPIYCSNGNYFYELNINPDGEVVGAGGGSLQTDVLVQNNIGISIGGLIFNGHELTVNNDVTIYGRLVMDHPNDVLNAGDSFGDQIIWKTGSSCIQTTNGTINVYGDWTFEDGVDQHIATGNTAIFFGSNNSTIFNYDPDVEFGNLIINKTLSTHNIVHIPADMVLRVGEDLNIQDGKLSLVENTELVVQNELNVHNGAILSVIGTSGNECKVSGFPGYGIFDVQTGGTISAEYTTFEYFESAGIVVASGAFIDPLHPFNHCSFAAGSTGGTLLTINNNQNLIIDSVNFPANTWTGSYNVAKTTNQGEITFTNFTGAFSDEPFENDPYNRITWHHDYYLDAQIYMEGPYDNNLMNFVLMPEIPLNQPYSGYPWYYNGTESVTELPGKTVDWVLMELRDAPNAASASSSTIVAQKAVFVKNNGNLMDLDGESLPQFSPLINDYLYLVIWHRNHLGVMSAYPLVESGGVYSYDFTTSASQTHGGVSGAKEFSPGIWGMVGGDANSDGEISSADKTEWNTNAGKHGYQKSDFNLNIQVDNKDKNDIWHFNLGKESQVPD